MSTTEDERAEEQEKADEQQDRTEQRQAKTDKKEAKREERQVKKEDTEQEVEQTQDFFADFSDRALHIAEDVIYALAGILLVGGAIVVLVDAVYGFAINISDGVVKAIEKAFTSMLIVFILVELLAAVRVVITERTLVAEPFLIVGVLAAIKEMVTVATFKIEMQRPTDAMLKIAGLGGVVIALAVAILLLRRGTREPPEAHGK
jgi:uncharacterized membrane protein (DUF373 family)